MEYFSYHTPWGACLQGAVDQRTLHYLKWQHKEGHKSACPPFLAVQLDAYFAKQQPIFALKYQLDMSDFQQTVLAHLQTIPYGQTQSYGDVATAVGSPKAARAVGLACRNNPFHLVIPCHRVISSKGKLTR